MRKLLNICIGLFLIGCTSNTKEPPVSTDPGGINSYINLSKLCLEVTDLKWQEVSFSDESGIGPTDKFILATFKTDSVLIKCTDQINTVDPRLVRSWIPEKIKQVLKGEKSSCSGNIDDLLIDKYNFGYFLLTEDKYVFIFMSRINK